MKRHWIIGALIICIATSLYLRIALPYEFVFTGEWIKFTSVDAYWQMMNIDRIAIDFPAYAYQLLDMPLFHWLLSAVIWGIGLGSPTQHTIDTVAVYFPPVLAALTVIPVFFIGKALFGRMAGLLAAALIAILPGEWLGRSILGFTDHHVAEVLFSTTAMMFFILSLKVDGRKRVIYSLLTALFLGVYLLTWIGGMLFVFIIVFYVCMQVAIDLVHHRKASTYPLVLLGVFTVTAIVIYTTKPEIFSNMAMYINSLSGASALTTMELRPLLYPTGTFTLMAAWGNFTTLLFLVPVALLILFYMAIRHDGVNHVLLFVWSIIILIAMLEYRRFAYYFAINASLLASFLAWYIWQRLEKRRRYLALVVTILLVGMVLVPNFQQAKITARHVFFTPSDAWCGTLSWVRDNTPADSKILAWWDYGYWITRESHRTVYVNPSQDTIPVTNTARMFLSQSEESKEAGTILADYIILDFTTSAGKFWAVATWAGLLPTNFSDTYYISKDGRLAPVRLYYPEYYQSLLVRLYNFNGQGIIPHQSSAIHFDGRVLTNITSFATFEEASALVSNGNGRIVGTSPFISPVRLEPISQYALVYSSPEKINGVPEVKVFRILVKEGNENE